MSLILDALKKSEKSRHDAANTVLPLIVTQRRSGRTGGRSRVPLAPVMVIVAAVAVAGVLLFFLRSDPSPVRTIASPAVQPRRIVTETPVAAAPIVQEPAETAPAVPEPDLVIEEPEVDRNNARQTILQRAGILSSVDRSDVPPRLSSLGKEFRTAVAPLRLDFHVFSTDRQRRVVFLNGQEFREGMQVRQNLKVVRIVPEGAIIAYGDQQFLLTVKD